MNRLILTLASSFLIISLFSSCEKKEPKVPNEEEVITTLTYTLTPDGGGTAVVFSFQDLDGDGGNDPVLTNGTLAANQTYTGNLVLLNEIESPAGNINEEIIAEAEDHQFFFQSSLSDVSVAYTDQDANGNPLGLATTLTTGNAGTGTLTLVLRHEPSKNATGVANGDITNAGGETDIEVTFSLDVQ